jgi:hypothetical protein
MNRYQIKVLYHTHTSAYREYRVDAEYFDLKEGSFIFRDSNDVVVFASPATLTIIEKVLRS